MQSSHSALVDAFDQPRFYRQLGVLDGCWALLLLVSTAYIWRHYSPVMDAYELGILVGSSIAICVLGWYWKPIRLFLFSVAVLSLLSIYLYGGDLAAADKNFFLKYFFASQSAVMWMSALFVLQRQVISSRCLSVHLLVPGWPLQ